MAIAMLRFCSLVWVMIVLGQMHVCWGCIGKERKGLLELKDFLISVDPDRDPVWTNNTKRNCCRWERVKCHAKSRRVIGLSLDGSVYANYAPFNLSLLHPFEELQSLNLSHTYFGGWFDNLEGYKSLQKIPKLEILDLSNNHYNNSILPFLRFATSLKTLILRGNSMEGDFRIKELNHFTSLEVLDLSQNNLNDTLPSQGLADLQKLKALDFSNNRFSGSTQGICKWRTLQELDISWNEFKGQLPPCFDSFTKLRVLDLSSNHFDGNLPNLTGSLKSLEYLSLSGNSFEGLFSYSSIKDLSKLKVLKISSRSDKLQLDMESSLRPEFQLRVIELQDFKLKKFPGFLLYQKDMRLINLSNNTLSGPFPTWLLENNTQLEALYLQYNAFHTLRLPKLVHNLQLLDLSSNNFDDSLSDDFGRIFSSLRQINLSGNMFKGSLGEMKNLESLDLSHNDFSGNLPRSLLMGCYFLKQLKLSNNRFDGQILQASTNLTFLKTLLVNNNRFTGNIGNGLRKSSKLSLLDMSNNDLTGTIPSWMGNFDWRVLMISNNSLEGTIPSTLFHSQYLTLMDLSRNKLSGSIPSHFSNGSDFEVRGLLYLHDNDLTGALPATLSENLLILDVRNNRLSGNIPQFINASNLSVLLLRGNDLRGPIPRQLCDLSSIRILDLSYNRLNETIPPCLSNLSFGLEDRQELLRVISSIGAYTDDVMRIYFESILELDQKSPFYMYDINIIVEFAVKQRYDSYLNDALFYLFGLDLSNNELSGEIPEELGDLKRARSLNLSHNSLVGSVPESFSKMKDIESLDLSFNKLYGPIPLPLTELNSLAVFNVSYNNLSGTIPRGKQFNTFDEKSYLGNPLLCGLPTNRSCETNNWNEPDEEIVNDEEGNIDTVAFVWSLCLTYVTVLVGIFVFICFDSPWRQGWFRLVDTFVRFLQNTCT